MRCCAALQGLPRNLCHQSYSVAGLQAQKGMQLYCWPRSESAHTSCCLIILLLYAHSACTVNKAVDTQCCCITVVCFKVNPKDRHHAIELKLYWDPLTLLHLQFNVQIRKHTMKTKFSCTRYLLHWPIRKLVNWGQSYLSKALLVTCEVAMEYMLALTYSPQVWACQTLGSTLQRYIYWLSKPLELLRMPYSTLHHLAPACCIPTALMQRLTTLPLMTCFGRAL